jgi:hypothetical protein
MRRMASAGRFSQEINSEDYWDFNYVACHRPFVSADPTSGAAIVVSSAVPFSKQQDYVAFSLTMCC